MIDRKGKCAAVAAMDSFAAKAGIEVLRKGGNAVDAAVAAALVECVVQPQNIGIGGYGGAMLIYLADQRRVVSIDFDSVAPMAASEDMYQVDPSATEWQLESGTAPVVGRVNEYGCLSVSVPGNVAGLALALRKYGTMSWADVSGPAIALAEEGFPVYPGLAWAIGKFCEHADETSIRAFLPDGTAPGEGEVLVQRDLAELLMKLSDDGPEAFYAPELAGRIVEQVRRGGGVLQLEDFARFAPTESEPIPVPCGECNVCTPGLPAGGLTALQIARTMHAIGFEPGDYTSGRYHHLLIEVSKLAWLDRIRLLGDPLHVDDPTDALLSADYAAKLASRVMELTAPDGAAGALSGESHTAHIVTADSHRNMVSLTATQGATFGSCVVVDGLGLVLGHGMSRFDPVPGRPNSVASGKRMLHNMSPMMLVRNGAASCVFGLPGGRRIVNVAAQMALGFTMFGMTPAEAVLAPRVHTEGREPVAVSDSLPAEVARFLESSGHQLQPTDRPIGGPASAIVLDPQEDAFYAASQRGEALVEVL